MRSRRSWAVAFALAAALAGVGVAVAQTGVDDGRIGRDRHLLGNGRMLDPFGRPVTLGNFPTGGAVAPDGRYYWTISAGRGPNDVRIVDLRSARVIQTLPLPGASGGIAFDPRGSLVYVSGVVGSPDKAQASPPGTPGINGDVVHVFRYDSSGHASYDRAIQVPPQAGAPTPQNFPPTNTTKIAWPDRLAISPDGATLLVPLNLADSAALIDVAKSSVRYIATGHYPYAAAITPDGSLGLVSNETPGTVSVIDLHAARKLGDIQVGAHLSHPEAIAIDPTGARAYVAIANADQVAVVDLHSLRLERTLSVGRPEGLGTSPVALTVTPDGARLLVAEASADEISVFRIVASDGQPAFTMIGRIPTAEYPVDIQVVAKGVNPCGFQKGASTSPRKHKHKRTHRHAAKRKRAHKAHSAKRRRRHHPAKPSPSCAKLLYIAAKGLGTGPNPNGPQPTSPKDTDDLINAFQYLPLINIGAASIADFPSDREIALETATADRQLRPINPESAPPDTPLAPGGPIKHVFYIVRENRTYDQILGDIAKGDGDPSLALFGQHVTPNAHALANRFPLLDHFYANSEASIDGHFWTSAGAVSDYVHKAWFQNYRDGSSKHTRPYDFGVYAVTWPGSGFLLDQAVRQGISYFNYGEALAGVVPFPDKDRTNAETQFVATKLLNSDLGTNGCYPNDASIGKDTVPNAVGVNVPVFDSLPPIGASLDAESRYRCFALRFQAQVLTGTVPTFNNMVLSNDHTRVLDPGAYTPTAMIADNDYGLGQIIDLITHSAIWSSSAIFVTEDDSQDGADHVDAHRTVGFVISPYTKPGAVVHRRYDMLSMIRSMELIMGMRPLGLGDALATPMYDAFSAVPYNAAPYVASPPNINLLAVNPTPASPAAAARLRFRGLDQLTQRYEDRLLWQSVKGAGSPPPPPGPNAVVEPNAGRLHPNG